MDIDGNMLHILGYKKVSRRFTKSLGEQDSIAMDDETVNIMHDIVNYDPLYDADEEMVEESLNLIRDSSLEDYLKIRRLLLNRHKYILEQFIIVLLCLN